MNIFVVDNNIFSRTLKNMSLDSGVFDHIYLPWSTGMQNGSIISVDEVYNELDDRWGSEVEKKKITKEGAWLKAHKSAFKNMTDAEGKVVSEIFKNMKFREGVKEKSLREGTPEADAILVAKAKCVGGIIVTAESSAKPNSEKIPNICVALEVPFIDLQEFYKVLNNLHTGKPALDNLTLHTALDA